MHFLKYTMGIKKTGIQNTGISGAAFIRRQMLK